MKSLAFIFCVFISKAQDSSKVVLSGSVKDAETGEALIGATVLAKIGVGAVADLDGNFIKEWKYLFLAKKDTKGDIQACCSGKQKTAGGFSWKYNEI